MKYAIADFSPSAAVRRLNPGLFANSGIGKHLLEEKQQDGDQRPSHNKARVSKANRANHPVYRVAVSFKYSDFRGRDIDGSMSTILDCITASAKRLLGVDSMPNNDRGEMRAGR